MAKSNRINKYSTQMIEIAGAVEPGRSIKLTFRMNKEAYAARFEFYGLKRAIEAEGAEEHFAEFMRAKLIVDGGLLTITSPEDYNPGLNDVLARAQIIETVPKELPEQAHEPLPKEVPEPDHDQDQDPYAAFMGVPETQRPDTAAFEAAVEEWLNTGPAEGKNIP